MTFLDLSVVVTGKLLFSSKQQFNDINITVVASFVFVMFCCFQKDHFSQPHSITKVSRITIIYFFQVLLYKVFLRDRKTWGLTATVYLICFVWCFVSFNRLPSENVIWDDAKSLNVNFSSLSRREETLYP